MLRTLLSPGSQLIRTQDLAIVPRPFQLSSARIVTLALPHTASRAHSRQAAAAGLHKKYTLNCMDEEHLSATADLSEYPVSITADAAQLHSVLTSFQRTLDEVTLVAYPDNEPQGRRARQHKHIRVVSYFSPAKGEVLEYLTMSQRRILEVQLRRRCRSLLPASKCHRLLACHSAADRCNAPACAQPRATQICLVFAESCNTCYSLRVFLCGCAEQILKKRGGALHTSFELDTTGAGLFKAYENTSDNTLDMTFNVKDFAVIAQLCKVMSADIVLHVNACGNPLVAKAVWPDAEDNALSDCVAAELLVATILESVQVQLSLVH